jgi:NADH dehydrogenase
MNSSHKVVIIGGGFAGLSAARHLDDPRLDVTLVDRRNFHLFQPLLYQVATGGLSPADIASPLRSVLKKRRNVRVLMDEAVDFDLEGKRVICKGGELPYDTLIVSAGSENHYFGNDSWRELAPGLKTIEDATQIRKRILCAFETAEREKDLESRLAWLGFAVIGAGPTGVELAGTIGELARDTLKRDFRSIDPGAARITLVDASPRILPSFAEDLAARAAKALQKLGVTVRTGLKVTRVTEDGVELAAGEKVEFLRARTVLWAAGVASSPLGRILAAKTGAGLDRSGRVMVEPDLSLRGHPEILVLGDLAHFPHQGGKPLPGVAPVALQQGRYVAMALRDRLDGKPVAPFRYRDKGSLATVGRSFAIAELGRWRFSGFLAWLLWLFIHLLYIVEFENRVLVLIQWAWNYFTWNRAARLITWQDAGPPRSGT